MKTSNAPALSVILITPHHIESIRRNFSCLRKQTARDQLEVIVVAPDRGHLKIGENDVKDFFRFCVLETGRIDSIAKAKAAGFREARAPIVSFLEDHVYPDPHWAEAFIHAHRQPWAAVGPVVANANPGSLTSWVNLVIEYNPWLEPQMGKETDHLPGNNGSYKKDILLGYGDSLEAMLEAESVLHWDLKSKGHKLYLEPKAKIYHLNFSSLLSSIPLQFHVGRVFAAARSRRWGLFRRMFYFAASPLIPWVRLGKILYQSDHPEKSKRVGRMIPALCLGLVANGWGEMSGYALGKGNSLRRLTDFEFNRHRFMNRRDQAAFRTHGFQ